MCFPRYFYSVAQCALDFLREVIEDKHEITPVCFCIGVDFCVAMGLIPDEAKCLPPPGIANRNSVWLAGVGWFSAMLQNAVKHRPPLKSG